VEEEMPSESTQAIIEVLRSIPNGRVFAYGAAAVAAGLPRGARQVVRILNARSRADNLPWWRLLRRDGTIALPSGGGLELQKALLEAEGVEVDAEGRVDMKRYAWTGESGQSECGAMDRTPIER
jgi:methylated-DNA-protein-cysteine methyltransferase-like protein